MGQGEQQRNNPGTCCGFLQNGFHSSYRRKRSDPLLKDLAATSFIITKRGPDHRVAKFPLPAIYPTGKVNVELTLHKH